MRVNCGNCENLCKTKGVFQIIGCSATGLVVPQETNYVEGVAVFKRVPMDCPLDGEVTRSEVEQPQDTWTTMSISKIKVGKRK